MKQIHKLNGVEINEPNNYQGLEIEVNYDRDGNTQTVSINDWEFGVGDKRNSNDGAEICNTHINNGTTGGVGVGEGLPYELILDDEKGSQLTLFDGYVNLWKAEVECNLVTAPAVEQGRIDWLNDKLDSFSFEYLESIGEITSANYVPIPYCINKKVNGIEVIVSIVTVFIVVDKLRDQVAEVQKSIARLSSPFGFTEVAALVFQILYMIVLITALIKLVVELYNTVVQPVKYHYGMYERDLVRIGLNHLGLKLSSSILDNPPFSDSVIMPEKFNTKEDNTGTLKYITGFFSPDPNEQTGYYKGTFGQLFRMLIVKYHAKIQIIGDTLYFEKQSYNITSPAFAFPPIEEDAITFNHSDFISNELISFATDLEDRNTIQEYLGTSVQIITSPKSVDNKTMQLLEGYVPTNINMALAKTKTELSFVEQILNAYFKVVGTVVDGLVSVLNAVIKEVNAIIKALNKVLKALRVVGIKIKFRIPSIPNIGNPHIKNLIEDRVGMMVLESDYTSVSKNMLLQQGSTPRNNKILGTNQSIQNARYLWENYHYFRSFVPQKDSLGNQYKIKPFNGIPFCYDDYTKIRTNSSIFDSDNNEGELIEAKFNPYRETISGSYKIQSVYTTNLKETIIEPNGR